MKKFLLLVLLVLGFLILPVRTAHTQSARNSTRDILWSMPKPKEISVTSTVIRHHSQFSRLVTIPLKKNSIAKTNWEKLTQPQRRMLREDIFAAKTSATRRRRAERVLI